MGPTEHSPKEIPEAAANLKPSGSQEPSYHAPASGQTVSAATRAQDRHQKAPHDEPPEFQRMSSTSEKEPHHNAPTPARAQDAIGRDTIMEQNYMEIDSQNKELRNQMKKNQAALTALQARLAKSETRGADLQQRLEEASNTIFQLRPQRQEYTESEIEEDYRKLVIFVKDWVNVNCESFLDDDDRGFDMIRNHKNGRAAHPEPWEIIMLQFQSEPRRWIEAKEHILVAVVMRYLFDQILNQSFSAIISDGGRNFLATIQNSMENMEPQKDLLTIRTWRSETVTAINSCDSFMNYDSLAEPDLTTGLYKVLRKTLSSENVKSTVMLLSEEVVGPAIALAQKTQSVSSIWTFKYSDYSKRQPGEFGSRLPNFLDNIQDFRCINMSNRHKLLKPVSDLATLEQRENLRYVLDIFPGLYCQRVTTGDSPPASTISQPILLVDFAASDTHAPQTQGDPSELVDVGTVNQNQKAPPARPQSKTYGFFQAAAKSILG